MMVWLVGRVACERVCFKGIIGELEYIRLGAPRLLVVGVWGFVISQK